MSAVEDEDEDRVRVLGVNEAIYTMSKSLAGKVKCLYVKLL